MNVGCPVSKISIIINNSFIIYLHKGKINGKDKPRNVVYLSMNEILSWDTLQSPSKMEDKKLFQYTWSTNICGLIQEFNLYFLFPWEPIQTPLFKPMFQLLSISMHTWEGGIFSSSWLNFFCKYKTRMIIKNGGSCIPPYVHLPFLIIIRWC